MTDHDREIDAATGTDLRSHDWDGIKELDTPLPLWWLWAFYITVAWGIGYTIAYPAWPMITEATSGILGYSTRAALVETIEEHEAANAGTDDKLVAASFEEIAADADLNGYALAGGAAIFRTYCSQCHGAGAAGSVGYPNLLDDAWLWGGSRDEIAYTVTHGIRWDDDEDTRYSEMPAFGESELLTSEEIGRVADFVLALSDGGASDEEAAVLYADNCAACHGDDGLGDPTLGAPNLADAIWLYGGDRDAVIESIAKARHGVMPAWGTRLSEAEIKQVAHYVHSLGGGE